MKEVDEHRFRQDLFYRLMVFPIEVPPLRERVEDIAALAAHFISQCARRMNRPDPPVSKAALDQLVGYDWPGNVRQLQNVVERSIILWQGGALTFDLPVSGTNGSSELLTKPPAEPTLVTRDELKRREREAILSALRKSDGKLSGPGGAAQLLGSKPSTLSSRIAALGINRRTLN